jgi:hypothetical protein
LWTTNFSEERSVDQRQGWQPTQTFVYVFAKDGIISMVGVEMLNIFIQVGSNRDFLIELDFAFPVAVRAGFTILNGRFHLLTNYIYAIGSGILFPG